jgi:hypothetical protein
VANPRLLIWHARRLKNGVMEVFVAPDIRGRFVREPSLLPVFGKLGIKPPVVIAAAPTMSKSMGSIATRMREVLSSHGGLALKLSVVVWTVVILAMVLFITQA